MKLCYWRSKSNVRNFGDELNPWIWNRLLPGFFDNDGKVIFVGIGTLLEKRMGTHLSLPSTNLDNGEPTASRIIVFGSGAGYSEPPRLDERWKIYCVRGPLTATLLGIDGSLAVTDPALLIRRLFQTDLPKEYEFSYMPHVSNANSSWRRVCDMIGIGYVDPGWPVEKVLNGIGKSEVLVTEALHGAVVADALRIPWIAASTTNNILSFKWNDWCASVALDYKPIKIAPAFMPLWNYQPGLRGMKRFRRSVKLNLVAKHLSWVARSSRPQLSKDSRIDFLTTELEDRLEKLKADASNGAFR